MVNRHSELVFGLVGAIGTDLQAVQDSLKIQLAKVGYTGINIRLSDLLREVEGASWQPLPNRETDKYPVAAMDAGDSLRKDTDRGDAMAALALNAIRLQRELLSNLKPRRAYVLNSLKRPEEADLLRNVYGPYFYLISAYTPRDMRVDQLSKRLAFRRSSNNSASLRAEAEGLAIRDEQDSDSFGQDVRRTFPLGDFFIDASKSEALDTELARFVELLFRHMWHTPTSDEEGMAFAYLARVRSASAARQVGAALKTPDGRLISTGTNEVPRSGGGQYWSGLGLDGRDFRYERQDTSDQMRRNILADVLEKICATDVLSKKQKKNLLAITSGPSDSANYRILRKAQLFDTIDYIRAVHAEMSAILSAPSRADIIGANLYVTTFPCHECARHIVMAGIKRVIYIEPYPKSLVRELYRDSIEIEGEMPNEKVLFQPFVGVAPSLYGYLFLAKTKERKDADGKILNWNPEEAFPHEFSLHSEHAMRIAETEEIRKFLETVEGRYSRG
jgi:cytidine deaminase